MRHKVSVLVLLFFTGNLLLHGQSDDTVIVRKFTQKDGLISYNIRKIIQDKWGFMWVATQEGLSRFDGQRFLNYSKNAARKKKLCGADIRDLAEDTIENLIWVLPTTVGINAINSVTGEIVKTIEIPGLGKEEWNVSLMKNEDELWIGTSTGVRIFNTKKQQFESVLPFPDNRKRSIDFVGRSMAKDEQGNIWVCYDGYGIVLYDKTAKNIIRQIQLTDFFAGKPFREILIHNFVFLGNGQVLFATSQGLRRIRYSKSYDLFFDNQPCPVLPALNVENINHVGKEGKTELLVAGAGKLYRCDYGLKKYQEIREVTRAGETNWLSSILRVYKDRVGNTWLGCQEGFGFISESKTPFTAYTYDAASNIKLDHVFAINPTASGNLLAGSQNGIVEINQSNGKYTLHGAGHSGQKMFTDVNGVIHVCRPDGLFIYDKGSFIPVQKIYSEFLPFASYIINSHIIVNDTLTILGTENFKGILLWNPQKKMVRSIGVGQKPSLASNVVNNIYQDRKGRVWVLSDNVITIIAADFQSAKEIALYEPETNNLYKLLFDMCEAAGSYWIACYGSGILQVDSDYNVKKVFNTQNGLSNDGVYQIYNLQDKHLLVTSNNGLSRIELSTSKINRYYLNDGLHSSAFEEVSGMMKDGKIYAGGVNGFTVIDPKKFSTNTTPPRLYITKVETRAADGRVFDTGNLLLDFETIPNNITQTTVHFTGLNYANPERTEYAYRIREQNGGWIQNGTQSFLQLIGLGPGTYTIEVKAINEDGVESKPVRLTLYFQPRWYQTWWFKSAVAVFILFLTYQFYRFRLRQIKREEAIRRRLASDLHDDLGSTMNSVNIYTNLALMKDDNNQYLKKIKENTQEAIISIRDIIWILDDRRDTIEQLVERIRHFAYPLCEVNGIRFTIEMQPELNNVVLSKEEKRNLYMMIKEAINNSVKYASPATISVAIVMHNGKLQIMVADDGSGFDVPGGRKGNGLDNIRTRSEMIKYRHRIESSPGNGTIITLLKEKAT